AVDVDRAGSALGRAAAVLGPREIEQIAKNPEQRHVLGRLHRALGPVDAERIRRHGPHYTRWRARPGSCRSDRVRVLAFALAPWRRCIFGELWMRSINALVWFARVGVP